MKCPTCGNAVVKKIFEDITVEACDKGCGSVWFDSAEFEKLNELHESAGEELLDLVKDENINVDRDAAYICPKCEDGVMVRHIFNAEKGVTLDECAKCAGVWIDYGALGKIQNQFDSEEERSHAAGKYYGEIFGNDLEKLRKAGEDKAGKADLFALLFRFVCPGYYIPEEQDWGSF